MSNPSVTINLVVHNGAKYVCQCLDSVLAQNYPHELVEINVLDNDSTDSTRKMIEEYRRETRDEGREPNRNLQLDWPLAPSISRLANFSLIESKKNLGMWPGQELLLEHSRGKYIVALSVDVILHPDFIKNAVEVMEQDKKIGALQGKVYQYRLETSDERLGLNQNPKSDWCSSLSLSHLANSKIIDTLGFQIFHSRRIVNVGHGEEDTGQYDKPDASCFMLQASCREIFAVEGAVPVFRQVALEDCRLESQTVRGSTSNSLGERGVIVDPDFFWYGDDLDLAWRMRLFGWKQVYAPNVIAWHDRKTTKVLAGGWREFIKIRRTVPMFKRRLDWRNTTLAIIKNDFTANWLRDLPFILWRQLQIWAYFLIFEPVMILEIFKVAKMLPRMLKRRREIARKAQIAPKDFRKWIN